LNPRPKAYESSALPLSYSGNVLRLVRICEIRTFAPSLSASLAHSTGSAPGRRITAKRCHKPSRSGKHGNIALHPPRIHPGSFLPVGQWGQVHIIDNCALSVLTNRSLVGPFGSLVELVGDPARVIGWIQLLLVAHRRGAPK
jgi:hypothetical protein